GLDRKALNQLSSFGVFPPAAGPLTSSTPFYTKKVEALYPFDRAKANQILDTAGWVRDAGGMRAKGGQPLAMSSVHTPSSQSQAGALQDQLRQMGIKLDANIVETLTYVQRASTGADNLTGGSLQSMDPSILTTAFNSKN